MYIQIHYILKVYILDCIYKVIYILYILIYILIYIYTVKYL